MSPRKTYPCPTFLYCVQFDNIATEVAKRLYMYFQEVDKWLRSRALENVATSTATLKSLIQLLEEVGNIVINDDIGLEVSRAVDSIKATHTALLSGQLKEAFLASRQAIISSGTWCEEILATSCTLPNLQMTICISCTFEQLSLA